MQHLGGLIEHVHGVLRVAPLAASCGVGVDALRLGAAEQTPDGQGAEVVLGLDRVGRVQGGHHILHGREHASLVEAPPLPLDDATTTRRRLLLELAGCGVWSHDTLVASDHLSREPLREQ